MTIEPDLDSIPEPDEAGRAYLAELDAFLTRVAAESPDVPDDLRGALGLVVGGVIQPCGRTTWRGVTVCDHMVPRLNAWAKAVGEIYLKPLPGCGSYQTTTAASAGTHARGGAIDIDTRGLTTAQRTRVMNLGRRYFEVSWQRDAITKLWTWHDHAIDPSCPNLSSQAAAQVVLYRDGYNGLASNGPDYGTRDYVADAWARYLKRASTTVATVAADLLTIAGAVIDAAAPPSEEDELMALTITHPITGEQWPIEKALWSMWTYILEQRDDPQQTADLTLGASITHDGGTVTVKQELANIRTQLQAVAVLLQSHAGGTTPAPEPTPDPTPAPAPKTPATQYGVDVSGHQTLEQVKAACANPKYGFAIVKATEGLNFDDPDHAAFVAEVEAAKFPVGHYHFAWPRNPSAADGITDPLGEAAHFLRVAQPKRGDVCFLDIEEWGVTDPNNPNYARDKAMRDACSWADRLTYTLAWLREVKRLTGATPLVYANWDWIKGLRTAATVAQWDELVTFPLWIAQYRAAGTFDTVSPKTGSANGWPVVMHQWTNNDGGLDSNYMPDAAAWSKFAVPAN